jgi:CHAD domain-containing protein
MQPVITLKELVDREIASFALAMDLPKEMTSKNTATVGRSLGKLRDLDVSMTQQN